MKHNVDKTPGLTVLHMAHTLPFAKWYDKYKDCLWIILPRCHYCDAKPAIIMLKYEFTVKIKCGMDCCNLVLFRAGFNT